MMVQRARSQFANKQSDLLSFLNVFGAYQCYTNQGDRARFCKEHFVRRKNISECHSLTVQLQHILRRVHSDDLDIKLRAEPPSNVQQIMLRQIIASGLIDQIARRWPEGHTPNDEDWARSKRNYLLLKRAYQCMSAPSRPVFIHPTSYIYSSAKHEGFSHEMPYQPEFVVYHSLHKSETVTAEESGVERRSYMRFVTVIEPHWLLQVAPHLCIADEKPLESPMPFYDATSDCVKWWVGVRFGPQQWELPRQCVEITDGKRRYQWFARFLLKGQVFEDLQCIVPYLQYRPQIITANKHGKGTTNQAVFLLLSKLEKHRIDSKHKMQLSLMRDKSFLLKEMRLWVYSIKQSVLMRIWPPSK